MLPHPRKRRDKRLRHLLTAQIPASQNEDREPGTQECCEFIWPRPNAFVLCEHYPAFMTHGGQPLRVGRLLRKQLVVRYDINAGISQSVGNPVATDRTIDEEGLSRQATRSQRSASSISVEVRP